MVPFAYDEIHCINADEDRFMRGRGPRLCEPAYVTGADKKMNIGNMLITGKMCLLLNTINYGSKKDSKVVRIMS